MGRKYLKSGRICAVALAVLCIGMVSPQMEAWARIPVDTGKTCTITVELEDAQKEQYPDLLEAQISVELYRIATIDAYAEYTALDGFEGVDLGSVSSGTAEEWAAVAEQASHVLGIPYGDEEETAGSVTAKPAQTLTMTNGSGSVSGLQTGLYLVYAKKVETAEHAYTFLPYLVSAPNLSQSTGADEWLYDITVGLKPEQADLYGQVTIEKNLNSYNASLGDATFIFQVDARRGEDLVYSNVCSLNFTEPGKMSAVAKNIPLNTTVTIEEIYRGASYELTEGQAGKYEITLPGTDQSAEATVSFTNDYSGGNRSQSSVVNHFAYDGTGWQWTQLTDNQETAGEE